MKFLLRTPLLACLALLGACSGLSPAPPADWAAQQAQLLALDHFSASGKIALRTAEHAESASMRWQQMGQATHLRLQGPLGIAATTIDSDGDVVEIRRGDDYQRWSADSAPRGSTWDLPLKSLPYWLKGIPDPTARTGKVTFAADTGHPSSLSQAGWTVEYAAFGTFAGYTLPTRLEVSRDETWARIILRRWENLAGNE